MTCTLCAANVVEPFGRALMLGSYDVAYYRCSRCGFIRTEDPYWLEEAYSTAINGSDVGLVRRNYQLATVARLVIATFFNAQGRFIDYAGGYGLFVRLMRDEGFDFAWSDKYCTNLFAQGFESVESEKGPYELLTAFEVFEHLADPVEELARMLEYSRNILFATQLLPEPAPSLDKWWYYGPEHGQHIAFHTRRSLTLLAERVGLNFYTNGVSMHLFTEKRLSQLVFFALARYRTAARLLAPLVGRRSLLPADYNKTTGSSLNGRDD